MSVFSQYGCCVAPRFALTMALAMCLGVLTPAASAGPFAPAAGQPGSDAIPFNSPKIVEWATGATVIRGPQDISNPGAGLATFGSASDALGPADGASVVSLGDGGSITLTFDRPIVNGTGPDFAVFENGFIDSFLELGFVEVSTDGTHFVRFPSISLTQTSTQMDNSGGMDPTNLFNLAGKYRVKFGTPFDLSDVAGLSPLVDVDDIHYVRVIDVVGSINPLYATFDSQGHIVNDPWPTAFASGGFDFDAVAVTSVPEPSGAVLLSGAILCLACIKMLRRRDSVSSPI